MSERDDRRYDFVLFGGTGFTGKLVADYLIRRYGATTWRWGLAGRNHEKLKALQASLAAIDPAAKDLPLIVADSQDQEKLASLAAETRVVCTTVGPYAKYGSGLVAACARHGTHYCDLTGEVPWMRQMIEGHHEIAQQSGARIVHTCGFDSIPSDLGTWMLQEAARERFGEPCEKVLLCVKYIKGGFSGGTIASMVEVLESIKDPKIRRLLANPYALNPEPQSRGPDRAEKLSFAWDEQIKSWTGPFVMAATNSPVVRRTNALLDFRYGRDFSYREVVKTGTGAKGLLAAAGFALTLTAFGTAMALRPTRAVLRRFLLPAPGEGPTPEQIENGGFEFNLVGFHRGEKKLVATVIGERDPGYGETAKMLSEATLALAAQELDTPTGVLTPAVAMGGALIARLREAGMVFEVKDIKNPKMN